MVTSNNFQSIQFYKLTQSLTGTIIIYSIDLEVTNNTLYQICII